MPDKKWLLYLALILAGVVFESKIRAVPVVGSKIPRL